MLYSSQSTHYHHFPNSGFPLLTSCFQLLYRTEKYEHPLKIVNVARTKLHYVPITVPYRFAVDNGGHPNAEYIGDPHK